MPAPEAVTTSLCQLPTRRAKNFQDHEPTQTQPTAADIDLAHALDCQTPSLRREKEDTILNTSTGERKLVNYVVKIV